MERRKNTTVQFSQKVGKMDIDALNFQDEEVATEERGGNREANLMEYFALSKDYKLNPIKMPSDFLTLSGVTTDVILFDRKYSSEYDEEVAEKRNKMRESGISTNLSNVMTKENIQKLKENQRKSQEEELITLRSSNKKEGISRISQMKALLAETKRKANEAGTE
eukprot:TRINITY_DN29148_c0_g1_i1.p1 TRINITY_DN29148_c0_g1~~TRINITY_DN29148_c0_g1_i1.p1  ORF type:complete len:165 (-),score=46.11 TRINITY_DN29148_c0_g1_i1:83-577(-)